MARLPATIWRMEAGVMGCSSQSSFTHLPPAPPFGTFIYIIHKKASTFKPLNKSYSSQIHAIYCKFLYTICFFLFQGEVTLFTVLRTDPPRSLGELPVFILLHLCGLRYRLLHPSLLILIHLCG